MTSRESHEAHESHKVGSELRHHDFGAARRELSHEMHSHPKEFEHLLKSINQDLAKHHQNPLSIERDKQNHISHINFAGHDIYGGGQPGKQAEHTKESADDAHQGGHRGGHHGGHGGHGGEGGRHHKKHHKHGKGDTKDGPDDDQDDPGSKDPGDTTTKDPKDPGDSKTKDPKDQKDPKDPGTDKDPSKDPAKSGDKDPAQPGAKPSVREMVHLVKDVAHELGLSKHATTAAVAAMLQESGGDPSKKGDYGKRDHKPHSFGLFQLNFKGGEGTEAGITPKEAMNPRTNAEIALKYFKQHDHFHDPVRIAQEAQRASDPNYYAHVASWVPTANRLIGER